VSRGDRVEVSLLSVDTGQIVALHLPPHFSAPGKVSTCCGSPAVVAVRRLSRPAGLGPGRSYDVFASNGFEFHQYRPGTPELLAGWDRLNGLHDDTWWMAFPATYDPERGDCTAFAADDGGIHRTRSVQSAPCYTATGPWVRATTQLHAFNSWIIGGIAQPACGVPRHPCPALYVPAGHNGTWVSLQGGLPLRSGETTDWRYGGCCGDSGIALVDPAVITQVLTARNGDYRLYYARSGPPSATAPYTEVALPTMFAGVGPLGGLPALSQVLTLPHERPLFSGDYVAVLSPQRADPTSTAGDRVVRNTRGQRGGWRNVGPQFGASQVIALATSGGHISTTVYVLDAGGQVYRGQVDDTGRPAGTGTVGLWSNISGGITRASALFANPYDPREVYVVDGGAHTIVVSRDGGQTWAPEQELTRLATRDGEFRLVCGAPPEASWLACSLNQIAFVRSQPQLRIAVLLTGGIAFSRDSGRDWIPLAGATGVLDRPMSAFYDPQRNPQTGTPSLYVALHGHGVVRIDAPFPTLQAVNYEIHGLLPRRRISAVNDTTGQTTPLTEDQDGAYRGTELFDAAVTPATFRYHYVMTTGGTVIGGGAHTLTPTERRTGVVTVRAVVDGPTASADHPRRSTGRAGTAAGSVGR
jgi:hypothetical protein